MNDKIKVDSKKMLLGKNADSSNAFMSTDRVSPYNNGSLNELTFAVKDNVDIAGKITGYGSPSWESSHGAAAANALCVDQLLAEGATCLGKTVSDELAYSLIGINQFYGTPLNAKAPERVPGGSSSGSASAVASGLVDFALGTDTAGSIRVPASNCGVFGYRPSHGVISTAGVAALAPSTDTVGVIAQNAEVLRKVINVLLGNTTSVSNSKPTICFLADVFAGCDIDVTEAIDSTISEVSSDFSTQHLSLAAITEKEIDCNWLFEMTAPFISAEAWNTFGSWLENEKPALSPAVQYSLENYAKPCNRKEAQKWIQMRYLFSTKLNAFLNKGNLLCFPTTPTLAPKIKEITEEFITDGDYYPRTMSINAISVLSSTPQITIPVAESNGVPVGLSFIAGYGQDSMLADFVLHYHHFSV